MNWNGLRFLEPLFTALSEQSYPKESTEIIMVDNRSTDTSVAYVREHFPWVTVIENNRNGGFSNGNNEGIVRSKGEYIVMLNNDTVPEKNWLSELVKVAKAEKAGAVVSKLMFAKRPGYINNAGSDLHPDRTWPVSERGIEQKDTGQFEEISEITAFCGASVLLSRKMLQSIGLLDESFFMYFEDSDLSWRGQKAGWKFYYAPKSVVQHIHTGTSTEHSPLFTFYVSRNRMLILIKNAAGRIAVRGIGAVLRDRIWYGLRQAWGALRSRSGARAALANLKLGVTVFASLCVYGPLMLLKRWHLVKERELL